MLAKVEESWKQGWETKIPLLPEHKRKKEHRDFELMKERTAV